MIFELPGIQKTSWFAWSKMNLELRQLGLEIIAAFRGYKGAVHCMRRIEQSNA
jgi:hypothetical protein